MLFYYYPYVCNGTTEDIVQNFDQLTKLLFLFVPPFACGNHLYVCNQIMVQNVNQIVESSTVLNIQGDCF